MTNPQHNRNLRAWIMQAHAIDTAEGPKTLCGECGVELDLASMTVGHWPVPDFLGGKRMRNNVRPECVSCNSEEGGAMSALPAKLVWEIVYERVNGFVYQQKMARLGLEPVKATPNFGKVHRRAAAKGAKWTSVEKNTPHRPRMWRVSK